MLRRWRPCWLHLYLRCSSLGWLRRATAALAGRWSRLRGAAPPQLCHAASPLIPQRQRPEWLFPRRPCTVSAYPGSVPQRLQCHGPGLQQVATSNGHDPCLAAQTPSPEAPGGPNPHLHRLLHQRRPAATAAARVFSLDSGLQGWRRSCSPETVAAVPGPAGRQSSAPQSLTSLATGNSEGGSIPCQEKIPST